MRPVLIIQYGVAAVAVMLTVLVVCTFIVPFGAAVAPAFLEPGRFSAELVQARTLRTIVYTFHIAIGSTAVAVAVGMPTAFFMARRKFMFCPVLRAAAAVPLAVPALIVALGFVASFGMNGMANRLLMAVFHIDHPPLTFLYSPRGVIIAQGFYNFPLIAVIVADGWLKVPEVHRDAARLLGANETRIFFTITLPALAGTVAAAVIPVFLYCFSSFLIVLLFGTVGGTTIETEIYQAARTTLDFPRAAVLSLIEVSCSLGAVLLYNIVVRQSAGYKKTVTATPQIRACVGHAPFQPLFWRIVEYGVFIIVMALIALFFLFPLTGIVFGGFRDGSKTVAAVCTSVGFRRALAGSLRIAPMMALLCCLTAFTAAAVLRTRDPDGKHVILQTVPLIPMALSSIVLGFGILRLAPTASPVMLICAESAIAWPVAFRQLHAALMRIPQDSIDASRLLSPYHITTIIRVYLPHTRTAMATSFGLCLAISIGDTTLPLVISIPEFDTLALYTYRLAGAYRFAAACTCGTVLLVLCTGIFALVKAADISSRRTQRKQQ
ncbi:MAG: iron ABC transporter permease [Treponema sp.]|nr:iron ABC transporter permease [Treponema sp.]